MTGTVQGVGFRPYVHTLAGRHGLGGWVMNDESGVCIEVQGSWYAVRAFEIELTRSPPPLSTIEEVTTSSIPVELAAGPFRIMTSTTSGATTTFVAPDVAPCADCLAELADPGDRRHDHPFISCTNCGPRYSIVTDLPYDRSNTTMARFALCRPCAAEYHDPTDRRFHAQPVCCPDCGPRMTSLVDDAADAIGRGEIVAVKGIGGYHLCTLADRESAVATLRSRKRRSDKPFALLVTDVPAAKQLCDVSTDERALLESPARPIVLLARRPDAPVARSVAPVGRELGVMLPPSPLHHLLVGTVGAPIVCTSGNVSQEPVAFEDRDAAERLGPVADAFLSHDRPIRIRVDDSVVRSVGGARYPVRRSRGYAPAPIALPIEADRPVLAVGADLKNTVAVARGRHAFVSQHVGDLEHIAAVTAFEDTIAHLTGLVGIRPEVIAFDLHPQYRATQYALESTDLEPVPVQHHHAHIGSCLADNGHTGPVIGVAFDGLGYGEDGTFWGGEFLVADLVSFERRASLRPVPLPGGDAAARQPWRMAAVYLEALGAADRTTLRPDGVGQRWDQVRQLARSERLSPRTSSAGRLFDAVASLLGVRQEVTYEGQAAVELEQLADPTVTDGYQPVIDRIEGGWSLRGDQLVAGVVEDVAAGVPRPTIAARFHRGLARGAVEVCEYIADDTGLSTVALSGGVFLNTILLESVTDGLERRGLNVIRHRDVPCNDGGISLGQAAIAAARRVGAPI